MASSSDRSALPLSALSVASSLLAVWTLRQRQRRLQERHGRGRRREEEEEEQQQQQQQPPPPPPLEEQESAPAVLQRRQRPPGQRQWAALEEAGEPDAAAAPQATPTKPGNGEREGQEGPPTTPRRASSAKSRPPPTVPKLQAAREAAMEAALAASASASGGMDSAASTPTHRGLQQQQGVGGGGGGDSTAMRVNRSLSEGPLPEVQQRVLEALAACPDMAGVGNRRIELLVHNLSHKDMILSLAPVLEEQQQQKGEGDKGQEAPRRMSSATSEGLVLCRPKFSLFQPVSEALLDFVVGGNEEVRCATATFPVYTREREDMEGWYGEEEEDGMPDTAGGSSPASSAHSHHQQQQERPSPPRRERAYTLKRQAPSAPELPVGFDLSSSPFPLADLAHFRIRRDDARKLAARRAREEGEGEGEGGRVDGGGAVGVDGVYFPLLATIIPKWRAVVHGHGALPDGVGGDGGLLLPPMMPQQHAQVFKIVFLVSGVGMPRDPSSSATGNSTEGTARLVEAFIRHHYPDVAVVRVHSTTNIFRYDENIAFVKNELLPLIEYYRDGAAERWGTGWRHRYRITISFADGSPARISAINAALRPYRPSFMHTWELKTFWHHAKMCLDDVEVHSFEDIDTAPPVPLAAADARAQLVVQEMLRFKQEVLDHYRAGRCADLASFWLRKTKKPVLAVLLVQKPGGEPVLYRGCNMEVSMPTGSLCAERNAIGSALAADLTLRRRDLKIVAVLSLSFKAAAGGAAAGGAAEPRRALDRAFAAVDAGPRNGQAEAVARPRMLLAAAAAAAQLAEGQAAAPVLAGVQDGDVDVIEGSNGGGNGGLDAGAAPSPPRVTVIRSYSVKDLHHLHHGTGPGSRRGSLDVNDPLHAPAPPPAPLVLKGPSTSYGGGGEQQQQQQPPHAGKAHHQQHHECSQPHNVPATLTIAVDSEDLNPLKPCGACMEWLKKIAEKNPEFRVATFTDEGCRGIYTEFISTS